MDLCNTVHKVNVSNYNPNNPEEVAHNFLIIDHICHSLLYMPPLLSQHNVYITCGVRHLKLTLRENHDQLPLPTTNHNTVLWLFC